MRKTESFPGLFYTTKTIEKKCLNYSPYKRAFAGFPVFGVRISTVGVVASAKPHPENFAGAPESFAGANARSGAGPQNLARTKASPGAGP